MTDYRLDRLNTREFEHLSQALCKKFVAVGVTPFGDGPDGGREASFDGKMDYPSASSPWTGYLVIQCKFRQRSIGDVASDTEWVVKELSAELEKYKVTKARKGSKAGARARRIPTYYIFITNAVLSGNAETGGHDRCAVVLENHASRLGMKGYAVWGFDEVRTFLDSAAEIRQAYLGFILPDDVLYGALRQLSIDAPDFDRVLANYLQKELQSDYAAKLESAGQHDEKRIVPLSSVFIDLPFAVTKELSLTSSDSHETLARHLISIGNTVIRYPDKSQARLTAFGRIAIVGGPGQGKSTIGQYLCQLYRAALLANRESLDPQCAQIIDSINTLCDNGAGLEVKSLRFPVRIILNRFASDLAKDANLSVVEYIRLRIEKLGGMGPISTAVLKQWISGYPWLFVLDGLDEVPSSSNRVQVLDAIKHFLIDLSTAKADAVVLATTRPQGYADEFAASHFQHLYLPPLSEEQALRYGSSLLEFRANGDTDKFETTRRRLAAAASNEATMRLMSSPLQVTIMATLVERLGEPPKQRYRLFEEYYRTIYTRETNREGAHSELLRDRKTDVDTIHYRTGLLLQAESELAGKTAALLTLPRFLALVRQRLNEQGLDGHDSDRLISEIKTSALDRLIFLVSPHDEEIGFEIRSLQEFMAAEAIARGTTEHVRLRIEEIAPVTNWRNVFLFLVGKLCDGDSIELLDRIILLCDELNDAELNPDYASIKWGSRLAIDILSDGATRPAPRRERRLLRTALELLDQTFFMETQELTSIYHDRLEDLYREKITAILSDFKDVRSLSAWEVLGSLASRQVDWARELHQRLWLKIDDETKIKVCPNQMSLYNDWNRKMAIELIPKMEPWDAFSLVEQYEHQRNKSLEGDWPRWLVSLLDIQDEFYSIESDAKSTAIAINIRCGGVDAAGLIAHILVEPTEINLDIFEMPSPCPRWESFFSVLKFSVSPNKDTLATALKTLARTNVAGASWLRSVAPWPLTALYDKIENAEAAEKFASLAQAGDLGDFEDWIRAEALTRQEAVTYDLETQPIDLPYDCQTLKTGMPLAGSYSIQAEGETSSLEFWANALNAQQETATEPWAIRCLQSQIFRFIRSHTTDESISFSVSARVVSTYFATARSKGRGLDAETVRLLLTQIGNQESIPELLDVLSCVAGVTPNRDNREKLGRFIRETVISNRLSERALGWAKWAANCGISVGLSRQHLEMSAAADALEPFEIALLRLGAADLSESECRCLIENFSRRPSSDTTRENLRELARSIERLPPELANPLRKAALDAFSASDDIANGWSLSSTYGFYIFDALDERRSALRTSAEKWEALGFLPVPIE